LKKLLILAICVLVAFYSDAQEIELLATGKPVSIRGLSVFNDAIIWVSGSQGWVGLTIDSGKIWKWIRVPGFEKSDFRDIEAFSEHEAIIMGITDPAIILRTTDGGNNWKTVFEDSSKSAFLDAMDFNENKAMAVGDPVVNKKYIINSNDKGISWYKNKLSDADSMSYGEALFAASGSNIRLIPDKGYVLVSGGKKSRLYINSDSYNLLLNQGKETTGANSIAINPDNLNQAFIVGGDFSHDTVNSGNSLRIQLSPFAQSSPITPPHGYRSSVEYISSKKLLCCGTSGVDISLDGGNNWTLISTRGFHVCRKAKYGNSVILAGPNGTIARLRF
jgi:photosystem II stability/assembly factor-like uncharacterized protein